MQDNPQSAALNLTGIAPSEQNRILSPNGRGLNRKGKLDETYLPTLRNQTQTHPRLFGAFQNARRTRRIGRTPCQRPQTPGRLNRKTLERFGRQYRLLKTEEFSSVFALKKQFNCTLLQISYNSDNLAGHPRLGLVVGKKTAKRANARNYMKRVIREWFRRNKARLPPRDYVVRVRRPFGRATANQARTQLDRLLQEHGCKITETAD